MSSLVDSNKYQEGRDSQVFFRQAIQYCMDGDQSNFESVINTYLRSHPSISSQDLFSGFRTEGRTLLHFACQSGQHHIVEFILSQLSQPKEIINLPDDFGFSPLINATIGESDMTVCLLISKGADVCHKNNDGATALHFAAGDGSVGRLELLIQGGGDINACSKSGTLLHWAAGKGRTDAMRYLVDHRANVNQLSADGMPAVAMSAVACCDEGTVCLIEAGADTSHILAGNLTILHVCAENGLSKSIAAMIASDTDDHCRRYCAMRTSDGDYSPLQLGAMSAHKHIVQMLLPFYSREALAQSLRCGNEDEEQLVQALLADGQVKMTAWHASQQRTSSSTTSEQQQQQLSADDEVANIQALGPLTVESEQASDAHKCEGNTLFKHQKYPQAAECYSLAIQFNPRSAQLWSNRSASYLASSDSKKALHDAEVARRLDPTWAKACYRLAAARLKLGMYEDSAVAAYEGTKLDHSSEELKKMLQLAVKLGQEEHRKKINSTNK